MTYIVAWIIYEIFYLIYYLGFFLVYFWVIKSFQINVPRIINLAIGILGLFLFAVSMCRARLAASEYSTNKYNLLEAHNLSGAAVKAYLSFLPIIGPLFRRDDDDQKPDYEH